MKRIELTERIKALIKSSVGDDIDYEKIAAFEATAVTSLPLNKRGTIFDRGQITAETFVEAATYINTGGFVPLHTLHEQGYEIPVGRLFYGEHVKSNQGVDELRALFFVDSTSPALISRLDTGVIEEVSVGMQFKRLLCSTCDVDLMEDSDSLWSQTCKNGHVMGMGTNHVKPDGVANFREMSLVSKGASNGAKVLGAQKRLLATAYYKDGSALAASLKDPEFMLFGSPTKPTEEDPMLVAELEAKVFELEAKLKTEEANNFSIGSDIIAWEASNTKLQAQLATAQTAKTEADTALAALQAAKVEADTALAALSTAKTEIETKLTQVGADLVAAQTAKTDLEIALTAANTEIKGKYVLIESEFASLKAAQETHLAQRPFKLPVGGVANLNTTTTDSEKSKPVTIGSPAFRTPK